MKKIFSILSIVILLAQVSCDDEVKPFDCTTSDLSIQLDQVTNASGCNVLDGSLQVTAQGGKEPYLFSLDGSTTQASGQFNGIQTGIYRVSVTDANGCTAVVSNVNVPAEGFAVSAEVDPDDECLDGNGIISIVVEGGDAPFSYKVAGGDFGENNIFTGLQKGDHQITVKDNSDCTVQLTVTVPHGFTGVSWSTDILPIIELQCSTNGCHDGIYRPDLRKYDKAKFYAESIKKFTQDGSMPFDSSMPQDQIDLIACWVDDGALEN